MNDFLDAADLLYRTGRIPDAADQMDFELVAEGRAALDAVYAKASIDSDNLESVFGAFEMAALFRQDLGPRSANTQPTLRVYNARGVTEVRTKCDYAGLLDYCWLFASSSRWA